MLDHLRAQCPGDGHDLARAMLASTAVYLVETFGREHALSVVDVPESLPGEVGAAEAPEADVVPH